ncbi:hypothetical protein GCM10010129_66520 [Streptomyces fumigatiscleroticus]|nr:hypothetical protein GCM10010129_66520 [Streptomyces fumigatiscleroticus]
MAERSGGVTWRIRGRRGGLAGDVADSRVTWRICGGGGAPGRGDVADPRAARWTRGRRGGLAGDVADLRRWRSARAGRRGGPMGDVASLRRWRSARAG